MRSLILALIVTAASSSLPALELDQPAPVLEGVNWLRDYEPSLDRMLLVDLFNCWLPGMEENVPVLMQIQSNFDDRVQVFGLSTDPLGDLEGLRKRIGSALGYPIGTISLEMMAVWQAETESLPTTILIDADGIVRWQGHPLDAAQAVESLVNTSAQP